MKASVLLLLAFTISFAQPRQVSGVYPHLAMYNNGSECGTGAVVPWADRLWVVTYSPHSPGGSDDKLYEIDTSLNRVTRPESIGGTPANRMIHRESNQLFIGPYAVDASRKVRAIPYAQMHGRPTGNARHLTDPANKIYYASMEEGFYEVDVKTLAVKQLYEDANSMAKRAGNNDIAGPLLPGYHGKGFYSGQGRVVYANNGEVGGGLLPPDIPSGCLAEWSGRDWTVVRRNQFTEVTGPGGIHGNTNPKTDPIWSTGWDHRSVILMLLDGGVWRSYRLPKATHTYDGAHGWNTEWPRIREIGETDLLMTMHGMFWRFPKTFSAARSAGIAPRSTYLRVIGDFARWNNRVVFGSDDTAKSEFLNTRAAKGKIAAPGQSHSNLWFVEPERIDRLGVPIGRGGVWVKDDVKANQPSEPYLFAGFDRRMAHLAHEDAAEVTFSFETDAAGDGKWTPLRQVKVAPRGYAWTEFPANEKGAWIRVKTDRDTKSATVFFHYANVDRRPSTADPIFSGIAEPNAPAASAGLVWARGDDKRTLLFASHELKAGSASGPALYELDADLKLRRIDEPAALSSMQKNVAIPQNVLTADAASVVYTDEKGARWRLPKGDPSLGSGTLGTPRVAREVSTERDLLNAYGIFYELPSNNAGGIAMVRPIATHNRRIHDYCSYRGLTVLTGVSAPAPGSDRIVRSDDTRAALWVGVSDDLWRFGKARGEGGPWNKTGVRANTPSDPYLMTGFDRKNLTLSHSGQDTIRVRVEIDITGNGLWRTYTTLNVPRGESVQHRFPDAFQAYWLRLVADRDVVATGMLRYE